MKRSSASWLAAFAALLFLASPLTAQDRPNILIIWGDDVGYWNVSHNNHGMMGYETPNIDRIAREGLSFTDYYGEQSCTAGRAAFITGQIPVRTGLTKVGMPGAEPRDCRPEDPTIAALLKNHWATVTGQFGKNHLGDRDEHLAHQPRVRRVLRQPVPPEHRGGAGERRLPDRRHGDGGRTHVPRDLRPPRRHPLVRRTAASRTPGRSPRKRMETVDYEVTRSGRSSSWRTRQ